MKLIPVKDPDEIKKVRNREYRKLQNIILEFHESNSDISEVVFAPKEYVDPRSLSGGLCRAAKRLNVGISVVQRKGKVYLIKE